MSSTTVASRAYAVVPAKRSRWSRGGAYRPRSAPAAGSARHRADAGRRDRAARSPDPQPASCRRSFRRGYRARAAPSTRHHWRPRPDRQPVPGCVGRDVLAGACVPTSGPAGAVPVRVRSRSSAGLRWRRGRLWHPRRQHRPLRTGPGSGDRCEGRRFAPLARRIYVPGILSSQPPQVCPPAHGTVPERRANVQKGARPRGTDRRYSVPFRGSAGRRKDAGTRWLGCCPPEMSTGETHPRAKRPMNRAKTPLRRRAAPIEMLTEQQLAILRSEPSANRVAKAISLAGVTQVTVADAVGLPQRYVSDVARQRYRTNRRERAEVLRLLRLLHRGPLPAIPPRSVEVTRTELRRRLLADTILGTDTAFDLIEEIAAILGVKWSHAPCIGLRGSIGGAVAPTAERIGADPGTDEPFESPLDGRSLRWKEAEEALCPIAIREWHANNIDDMMIIECIHTEPWDAVSKAWWERFPAAPKEPVASALWPVARSDDPLDADHSRCRRGPARRRDQRRASQDAVHPRTAPYQRQGAPCLAARDDAKPTSSDRRT